MEKLGVDIRLLIAQIINFTLFFLIIKKYVAKPFSNFLKEEKEKEKEKELALTNAKKLEEELSAKEEKTKRQLQNEIKEIIDNAKKQASEMKKQIITQAEKEALLIKEKAKKQLDDYKRKLKAEVKKEVIDSVFHTIEKIFKDELDQQTQRKITKSILKSLN